MDDKKIEELIQTERSILSRLWSIDSWVTIIGILLFLLLISVGLLIFSIFR